MAAESGTIAARWLAVMKRERPLKLPPTLEGLVPLAVAELADLPADEADERLAELLVVATLTVRERHPELPAGEARELAREFIGRIIEATGAVGDSGITAAVAPERP